MIGLATSEDLDALNKDIQILAGELANTQQKLDQLIEELKQGKEAAVKEKPAKPGKEKKEEKK